MITPKPTPPEAIPTEATSPKSASSKPSLLQLLALPIVPDAQKRLERHFNVIRLWEHSNPNAAMDEHGQNIAVLVTSALTAARTQLIQQLPSLQAICSVGVGYDNIDVALARERGIQVSNTPDVLNDCVADLTWGLIISTAREMGRAERYVRNNQWEQTISSLPLARRVSGKRLGIIGLGRVGLAVAQRSAGFAMDIRYHNRKPRTDVPWLYESSLSELAEWADILVVATVGGANTRHLIDQQILKALGPEGFLINIARGSVVDQKALIEALQNGVIAGAGLDVFEAEPNVPDVLKTMDNVVLLPHIASATLETRQAMVNLMLDNVDAFATTGKVLTPVTS